MTTKKHQLAAKWHDLEDRVREWAEYTGQFSHDSITSQRSVDAYRVVEALLQHRLSLLDESK